jgi:hypothetical protein
MIISEDIRQVIATGPLAHLTTLNADGSPQVSVVWVGIDRESCPWLASTYLAAMALLGRPEVG